MQMLAKYENYKLQKAIEEVKENEKTEANKLANQTTYINAAKLRIGCIVDPRRFVKSSVQNDYCPV